MLDGRSLLGELLVGEQHRDIGQRIAQRAHLPVEHSGDLVRVVDQDVVEAVVAVHDRAVAGGWDVGVELGDELVHARELAAGGCRELLLPASHLALEVAVGSTEVRRADAL